MRKKHLASFTLIVLGAFSSFADFQLTENGTTQCRIVVKKDAELPVSFGAKELSRFTEKVSSAKIPVVDAAVKGKNNIFVGTIADKKLLKASGIDDEKLKEDGFALAVKKNALYIVGQNPRGALYGCYEILKKYAGVRFLFPGEDGTYFSSRKSISIPEQQTVRNPYLRYRTILLGNEINGATFLARNNLFGDASPQRFVDRQGKRVKSADQFESVAAKSVAVSGHIMSYLMAGATWDKEKLKALYQAHPEYFPLINGKRVLISGSLDPNPCVSNPALLDLLAENLYQRIKGKYGAQNYVTIGNNDTTIWCECENCKKLDDPKKKGTKGARADRYWYAVMEIARRIWKKDPAVKLGGWAYQDFWYPPTKVKLDPRLRVLISFNNQCWKHAITDRKCSVNAELVRIMAAWKKTGHPFIVNRDEIGAEAVGESFLPSERILYENFKSYPELGYAGSSFCVYSPFPPFLNWAKNKAPFFGKNLRYTAMWQTCYLSAQFMWDINQDFDAMYEEANALYYGKAWTGGYREFRRLQEKLFLESPGCFGWAQGAPLGRCLDPAGSGEKLDALMAQAVEAAKTDADPRSLKHILQAKEIFELTWKTERKQYLKNFKELNVYRRTAPIKIDGVLDEPDWKNADALANFKPGGHTPKDAKVQPTTARVTYDTDNLYIAVECMEPHPEKIIAGKAVKGDWREIGDHVELFYNYPDMAEKYYHLAINANGEIIDAIQQSAASRDTSFRTKAKYAVKVLKDRWVLEIAIPASEIGMNCFDGATWKMNVARVRKNSTVEDAVMSPNVESSSCCNGAFHGAAGFVNIKFTPKRASGIRQGEDLSAWKNPDFNTAIPDSKRPRYARFKKHKGWQFTDEKELVPAAWNISSDAEGTYEQESGGNYFIRLKKGYVTQYFIAPGKGKLKISFRAKGKGKVLLWTSSYKNYTGVKKSGYDRLKETGKSRLFDLTDQWQTFSMETVKTGVPTERVAVRFTVYRDSILDLDDVYVTPVLEE